MTIRDKAWVDALLVGAGRRGCEYAFSCIMMWADIYFLTAADLGGALGVRSELQKTPSYLFPAGKDEDCVRGAVRALSELCSREGYALSFYSLEERDCEILERLYPGRFLFEQTRDAQEYLYAAESLRTLAGKKLHSKRNHIHRFEEAHPGWAFEEITPDTIGDCYKMNQEWCELYGCEADGGLKDEACAVDVAFQNFFSMGLCGGMIRYSGRVLAYAMGELLCPDTFNVRIEKAYHEIQGTYAIINREFARRFCGNVAWINREEDTGDEGLRKAKLSYRPALILPKYRAKEKNC